MRCFTIIAAAVLSSAATVSSAQQVAASRFQVSGIPVILKPVTANDVIAVRLYIRGGSSNLSPSNAGIESFMLEAATHGTAKYSKDAFNERLTETGTSISSDAGYDYSSMSLQGVRQHWNEAWDLFTEAALKPSFPASEVELVRAQLVDALKRKAEILPNVTGPILVESTIRLGYAIFTVATLSFFGLGLQPPSPDWGLTIASQRAFLQVAWWTVVYPALAALYVAFHKRPYLKRILPMFAVSLAAVLAHFFFAPPPPWSFLP